MAVSPCDTDGCADPEPDMFACQSVLDARGRPMDTAFLDALGDPFVQLVLKRPGACPRTYSDTIAKLKLEDDDRCADDPRTGMLGATAAAPDAMDTPGAVAIDDLDPPMDLRLDPTSCARAGG